MDLKGEEALVTTTSEISQNEMVLNWNPDLATYIFQFKTNTFELLFKTFSLSFKMTRDSNDLQVLASTKSSGGNNGCTQEETKTDIVINVAENITDYSTRGLTFVLTTELLPDSRQYFTVYVLFI